MKKLTTKEWIAKVEKVHGDRYDYSLVDYVNTHTKVKIICPVHGVFEQMPYSHLASRGCRRCFVKFNVGTEEFIQSARSIHGDVYDYSRVDYKGSKENVEIGCPTHGFYWQYPSSHKQGRGCGKCGYAHLAETKADSDETFILKAIDAHGDCYDYSRVNYERSHIEIEIGCPTHGFYWQRPDVHVKGHGCSKCGAIERSEQWRGDTENFIERGKNLHGDKFDYSQVDYTTNRTKVKIGCPTHGFFWQLPSNHLNVNGQGCQGCGRASQGIKKTKTTATFIQEAEDCHGDVYDYSQVNYVHSREHVKIGCKDHGYFLQIPTVHLHGCGCPRCGELKNGALFHPCPTTLYYVKVTDLDGTEYWKIGITIQMLKQRFGNRGEWNYIEVVWTKQFPLGREAWLLEQKILRRFTMYRPCTPISVLHGGHTELFTKNVLPLINGVISIG